MVIVDKNRFERDDVLTDTDVPLQIQFKQLDEAFLAQPYLPIASRIKLLKQIKTRLIENEQALVAATSKDFGYRTSFDTVLGDLLPTVKTISDIIKRLPKWSRNSVQLDLAYGLQMHIFSTSQKVS